MQRRKKNWALKRQSIPACVKWGQALMSNGSCSTSASHHTWGRHRNTTREMQGWQSGGSLQKTESRQKFKKRSFYRRGMNNTFTNKWGDEKKQSERFLSKSWGPFRFLVCITMTTDLLTPHSFPRLTVNTLHFSQFIKHTSIRSETRPVEGLTSLHKLLQGEIFKMGQGIHERRERTRLSDQFLEAACVGVRTKVSDKPEFCKYNLNCFFLVYLHCSGVFFFYTFFMP